MCYTFPRKTLLLQDNKLVYRILLASDKKSVSSLVAHLLVPFSSFSGDQPLVSYHLFFNTFLWFSMCGILGNRPTNGKKIGCTFPSFFTHL